MKALSTMDRQGPREGRRWGRLSFRRRGDGAGRVPGVLAPSLRLLALVVVITTFGTAGRQPATDSDPRTTRSPTQARASADRALAERARDIDRAAVGMSRVASFLAAEFGMTEETITAQKQDLRVSWGNLTIAHTLAANDEESVTVAQLVQLHDRGFGWGQVAASLGLGLDEAIRAVSSESRVARGRVRADGKAAWIGRDRAKDGPDGHGGPPSIERVADR